MPEGDTVYKVAAAMRPLLVGQRLERARILTVVGSERLKGSLVTSLETRGKNFLFTLQGKREMMLRVHLGMNGSWHRYAPEESWKGSARDARVQLSTPEHVFVCFTPKNADLFEARELPIFLPIARLGPDLLGPEPALEVAGQRALSQPDRPLAEVLLDQRVAAGLGNVYKSELCFLGAYPNWALQGRFFEPHEGYNPWTPVGEIGPQAVLSLLARGRDALLANLGGWERTTTFDRRREPQRARPTHWVYEMGGRPCRVCRAPIQRRVWGAEARVTYWCPGCQP
ncbi:MAG: putative endonuclease 8 2 [Candidatus Xenobia bacterium]